VCREMLAVKPGYENTMQVGCLLAQSGDVSGARACQIANLPQWPIYEHSAVTLQGEIALAEGNPAKANALLRGGPPSMYRADWPEHRVRAAMAAGDRETAAALLRELLHHYHYYWYQADRNGPGFLAWGLGLTGKLGLPADDLAQARRIREGLRLTT
jgi:hypothetical protein